MARKARTPVPPETPEVPRQPYKLDDKAKWGGFINIRLSDEQKAGFFAWCEKNPTVGGQLLDDMLGAGCKVTLAYDAEHEAYIVTVTGALVGEDPASRYASTSRAGTMNEVVALTVWKHFVLCDGEYGNYKPRDSSFMRWG